MGAYTKAVCRVRFGGKDRKERVVGYLQSRADILGISGGRKALSESGFKVVSVEFGEGVSLEIAAPAKDGEALNNYLSTLTQGGARHKQTDSKYVVY